MQKLMLPTGTAVHLGRVRPKHIFDHGRYRYVVHHNNTVTAVARLKAHYDQKNDEAPPPVTTNWLAKCTAAIAQPYGNAGAGAEGDCVIAANLKIVGGLTGNESGTPALSSNAEALATYAKICGPGDQGCVITNVLNAMKTTGIPLAGVMHKIGGYVAVDNTNQNEVQVACEVFGPALQLGINLPQAWYNAVRGNGFIWGPASGSIGGHDVDIVDVSATGVVIATWGYWGTITWAALADTSIVEECYCSLGPDWYANANMAPNGINGPTLQADLTELGNGVIPVLTPPVPVPSTNSVSIILSNGAGPGATGTYKISP
jgi:hypothetical protein